MMQESRTIRFLYGTALGRLCLKPLVRPGLSRVAGHFLSSPLSRPMVSRFIRKNGVDMRPYPRQKYRSFNDFFTRERENAIDDAPLISPCDGFLSAYPIDQDSVFHIKHVDYSLAQLLDDPALAAHYEGGTCLIFRLTPRHYHRYCFCCDGVQESQRTIRGKLHCVRPIAYTATPVFIQNCREYALLHTPRLGKVVQMEIGALLVGKISNHPVDGPACRGQEKGYFEFGGSTIMVLLEKGRLGLDPRLNTATEKDVRYGQKLTL